MDGDHAGVRALQRFRGPLTVWVGSRVAVAIAAYLATYSLAGGWLRGWYHWDVALYIKVAQYGYDGYPERYPDQGIAAFFPGMPLALRLMHVVIGNWVWAGLVVSAIAGAVAVVALARITELEAPRGAGTWAVLALVLSPYAVFLAAGYSEALFLAFALPAWLAARRRSWAAAGLLAAGASTVRVTGLFLAVALVVEYLTAHRRLRPDAAWLVLPVVPIGIFFVHLHRVFGDWLAWSHAEERMWGRTFTAPWDALQTTWHAATFSGGQSDYAWQFRADIAAIGLGIVLTIVLLAWSRWAEATYVGLQVFALGTSSFYLSVGRATLLWWPLWVLLGRLAMKNKAAFGVYAVLATPLMFTQVVGFVTGDWVG
jgi:hypothetical protein